MAIRKVAIIGATGRLGPAVLDALVAVESFDVTVLQREGSQATLPALAARASVVRIADDPSAAELEGVLRGQDALVVTMYALDSARHVALAEACVAAGVQRFVPPDFGSVDSSDSVVAEMVPLYAHKTRVRERCQQLAQEHPDTFSWTSIVCGHFFDWGLREGLLGFDLRARSGVIFDDGEQRWSASTLKRIGESVAQVLLRPDVTRNKLLHVQSFCLNQLDLMQALMEADGRQFACTFQNSEEFLRENKRKMDAGDKEATENVVSVLGITRADWEHKDTFANELLGLAPEDMPTIVRDICRSFPSAG